MTYKNLVISQEIWCSITRFLHNTVQESCIRILQDSCPKLSLKILLSGVQGSCKKSCKIIGSATCMNYVRILHTDYFLCKLEQDPYTKLCKIKNLTVIRKQCRIFV